MIGPLDFAVRSMTEAQVRSLVADDAMVTMARWAPMLTEEARGCIATTIAARIVDKLAGRTP
jgi:hypothetical protein